MRQSIVASIFLLGLLAGCTSRDAGRPDARLAAAHDSLPATNDAGVDAGPRMRAAQGIAALPDRGQLVAFRRDVAPRRTLAYTWRPVDISEAHALHAIGGELAMTAPDGQAIRLRYERHIEHADGNWTWVGRPAGAEPGTEAIITFGEKAVFGTIPSGKGSPLRITTGGGRTWLMETDDGAIAALPAAHPRGTDALLPPVRGSGSTSALRQAAALGAEAATASAPTVDLLIGYTSGFATRLGGQSQANTRLVNLVDITNQAYANSQVDGRVRLVKTMQVNYPDATANSSALYALTGCTESACTQVDAALQPLHDARQQYGADAISLVRNFNDPENGGCGIAWLIGGAQTPIATTDEYAAMSVVSDTNGMGGAGSFPDNGFVCRDETLAHELGHNMGSAHDVATADGDDGVLQSNEYGRYPYSFGYKAPLEAGNFYTVMAYGESGQTRYRVFSNPQTTFCGGRPCGVADQADNARSLRQTMPLVAAFFQVVDVARADYNGDGRSDVVWNNINGSNVMWLSANIATSQQMAGAPAPWKIVGIGDFNADLNADILWRNETTGQNMVWRSGSAATATALAGVQGSAWQVEGVADFDGDGQADILWRNESIGYNRIWKSGNASVLIPVANLTGSTWKIVGVGDFDGNGIADILWRNTSTGQNTIWKNASSATQQGMSTLADQNWQVAGVGDFDGDARSDVLWRHGANGANAIWYSANAATAAQLNAAALSWSVGCVADFNGDLRDDVLWRNSNGTNSIWLSGNIATPQTISGADPVWRVNC